MEQLDSRRLPGPNLLWLRPGAVIDVAVEEAERSGLLAAWERQARCILDAVGWQTQDTCVRSFEGGASLAISAPLDALYAATEVNEWALESACTSLAGEPVPDSNTAAERLRQVISDETRPRLLALRRAAEDHGVSFLSDDDEVSVGLGQGSLTWPVADLPDPGSLPWDSIHDVPLALVTGTNGKTTTVRLLACMARAAGMRPGFSSTDQVVVGEEVVESGDWSGPGGARRVLRDTGTQVALLETARGGMLRRGLAVERADVAAVLNVGADHLGEWGVGSVEALCQGKFVVTSVAPLVVLNADDEAVSRAGRALDKPVIWFSIQPPSPWLREQLAGGGKAYLWEDGSLVRYEGNACKKLLELGELPIALGGAARHNVANALAAAAIAEGLGLDKEAILAGLRSFRGDDADNPGRMNRFKVGGADVIVDFAHNPHGLEAMLNMACALPAKRRLVLLGQAGDRDDEAIGELARLSARSGFDHVILKDMEGHRRGREVGEVVDLLARELEEVGFPLERCSRAESEAAGVEQALEWAQPGDLLLLLVHEDRAGVLDRIRALQD
ncbi:MAG TPA: Mur ligase [Planctomycetes bacterium]|nr:Mur ligase [Planctomycetota bacterium]